MATSIAPSMVSSFHSDHYSPKPTDSRTGFFTKSTFMVGTVRYGDHSCGRRNYYRRSRPPRAILDDIPKQFRGENLKDGLMDNYKNFPKNLYGLTPAQLRLFMAQETENVTEESISSAASYRGSNGGLSDIVNSSGKLRVNAIHEYLSVAKPGKPGGPDDETNPPPDLPSLLLHARIVYIGLPIVPQVAELLVAQFLWLDWYKRDQPIHVYINSSGTQDENHDIVASETDAFMVADCMGFMKTKMYTVNLGMAYGQAGMLLSLGTKGCRYVQEHCSTKLYLPKMVKTSGQSTDMWIRAKDLESASEDYLQLLSYGTGKPEEELFQDLKFGRHFEAQEAIDYGIADKIYGVKARELNNKIGLKRKLKLKDPKPEIEAEARASSSDDTNVKENIESDVF